MVILNYSLMSFPINIFAGLAVRTRGSYMSRYSKKSKKNTFDQSQVVTHFIFVFQTHRLFYFIFIDNTVPSPIQ